MTVEASDAAEAGRDRHVMNRQRRFVEQLLRKVRAAGQRDLEGRGAEMLEEQSAEMAGRDAQPLGERFDPVRVQRTGADQA